MKNPPLFALTMGVNLFADAERQIAASSAYAEFILAEHMPAIEMVFDHRHCLSYRAAELPEV